MKLGSHVSMSNGVLGAVEEALSYGATALMLYTGAPQNTRRKDMSELKVEEGVALLAANGLSPKDIVVHAPYIVNLGSIEDEKYSFAIDFISLEVKRTAYIGAKYLVLHPGAFTKGTLEGSITRIGEGLNQIIENTKDCDVIICLETMAGKGSEVGRNFGELAEIIKVVENKSRVGVCMDTCHIHDSGYDIHNFDAVLDEFDSLVGIKNLHVLHINGSLNDRGAKKDRHANLGAKEDNPRGEDKIGLEAICKVCHNPRIQDKIFVLETPWLNDSENLYKEEIALIRGYKK